MQPTLPEPNDWHTFGTIVEERAFVISVNKKTRHIIVYAQYDSLDKPVVVGNGVWDQEHQDITDGTVNTDILTDEVCDGIVESIKQSSVFDKLQSD